MSNITRTSLDALSQANFPNNTTQQISPADLRDWIESAVDSFVTQKDTSTFENAFYECKSSTITVAGVGSCNLALATGNFVHISSSGSATITSFGTLPAGSRFILNFEVAVTIQYNATQMILPGGTDIITAAGDSVMVVSEGSGNWRLIGYFPASGLPVGTVTAVTASAPLSSTGGNAPDISIPQATGSVDGYLSSTDWTTFNNKGNGTVTSITASSPLTGGTITGSGSIGIPKADASTDGYLDNADFATFNGKQDALSAGTGISLAGNTVTNTAPDLTVALTAGTGINVTGTYPSFTIAATGTGGTPGGADGQIQYNNGLTAFGGVSDLNWDDINNVLTINTPRIGQSNGNGHMHIHSANSAPSGLTDYLTMFWQKATRVLGFRSETDTFESYIQLTAPTADRTYTFPDDSGNVLLDSATQTLTNKTLTSPSITTPAITTPAITGITTIGNGASAGEIRLLEPSGSGTDYVAIKAQAIPTGSSYSLTLPTSAGTSGQVLQTDGSGGLSWATNGGTLSSQFLKNTTATVITNPSGNTILETLLIPAGTFTSNSSFVLNHRNSSTVTTSAITVNININTSAAIGGLNIHSGTVGAGTGAQNNVYGINLYGGGSGNTTRYMSNPWTASSAIGTSTTSVDWSVNQYIVVWVSASANRNITNLLIAVTPT